MCTKHSYSRKRIHFLHSPPPLLLGRGGGRGMAGHLGAHPAGVLAGVMQRPGHRRRQHRGQRQERLRWCGGGRRKSEEIVTDLKMIMFCHHLSVRIAGWFTSAGGALSWAGVIPGTPSMPRLLGPAPLLLLLLWDLPHLKCSRVSIWRGNGQRGEEGKHLPDGDLAAANGQLVECGISRLLRGSTSSKLDKCTSYKQTQLMCQPKN